MFFKKFFIKFYFGYYDGVSVLAEEAKIFKFLLFFHILFRFLWAIFDKNYFFSKEMLHKSYNI